MSNPLTTFSTSDWQFNASVNVKPSILPVAATLGGYKFDHESRDHKLADYVLLGILSMLVHSTVVSKFINASFEQDIVTPVKPPPKVQITFTKPKPKPVVIPPVVIPPPIAQIVQPTTPKKTEPPKTVAPKPVVHKAVPLKPPAVKPVERTIEPTQTFEPPTPITQPNVPVSNTAVPVAHAATVNSDKVTAPTASADYLHNPGPEYPDIAMDNGWEGKVLMKVHVQPDGKPDHITVTKSSGQKILDDAAVKTVQKWSFVPAMQGDTPVAGWVIVPITFNIS